MIKRKKITFAAAKRDSLKKWKKIVEALKLISDSMGACGFCYYSDLGNDARCERCPAFYICMSRRPKSEFARYSDGFHEVFVSATNIVELIEMLEDPETVEE